MVAEFKLITTIFNWIMAHLRTPGPTYSIDVAFNVTVFMNISAYSCAGYSDSFFLEISKGEIGC